MIVVIAVFVAFTMRVEALKSKEVLKIHVVLLDLSQRENR